jgi:hypothetical protein
VSTPTETTTYIAYVEIRKVVDKPEVPGRYATDPPAQKASKERSTLARINVAGDTLVEIIERAGTHLSLVVDSKGSVEDGKVTR